MIPEADDKVCNRNSRYLHETRQLKCRNKLKHCLSLSSI